MAKELEIKIKVDGQEIDIAKKSTKELTDQIAGLRTKLSEVPIGSAEFKKIQGDINNLEAGFIKAKNATQPFLQSMSELPGVLGVLGQSIQGVKKGFDLLAENPLIAVFTAAVFVIEKVAEKLESMKAVSEALEKAMSIFGTVTDTVVNAVLKPLVNVVSGAIEGITKLSTTVLGWVSGSEQAADATEKYADQLRELNLQSGELAIKQAEAAAKINEAKEKAQDANLPLKERIGALKDAKKFEDETATASKNAATLKVQDELIKLNTSLDANAKIQAAIESGHKEQLRWAAEELLKNDEVNVDKVKGAQQTIATLYDIDAQASLRNRRLNTTTRGLEKEDESKATEEAKAASESKKDFEKRLNDFKLDLRLQNITDEKQKGLISLDNDKTKSLAEIETLKLSESRKAELRKAALEDYAAKEKVFLEKQKQDRLKQEQTFEDELTQLKIGAIKDEIQKAEAAENDRYQKQKSKLVLEMLALNKTTEEMNEALDLAEQTHQNNITKIKEDGAKKGADLIYKQIEFERQTRVLDLQNKLDNIDNEFKAEDIKIRERQKVLEEQANEDRLKEIENLEKLHNAKEISDDDFFIRSALQWQIYNTKILKIGITTTKQLVDNQMQLAKGIDALGVSVGQVADAFGKETEAGKALQLVSQGLILTSEILTFKREIEALTTLGAAEAEAVLKGSSLPFPGNLLAIATTITTFASIITTISSMVKGPSGGSSSSSNAATGQSLGKAYGQGGVIDGPPHAQGGMMINAEGGEAIMTRGAVTMFGPLLSQLNQAGGGTSFNVGAINGTRFDNPTTSVPQSEPQIIKTYVVEKELTSSQQKQARLKNLSTL